VLPNGVSRNARYTAELVTRAEWALIVSPGETVGPEGLRIPLSGHNVILAIATTGPEPVTLRAISAGVVARGPFPGQPGLGVAHPRMPALVLSAALPESLQRAVAASLPLAAPDIAILLDAQPTEFATVNKAMIEPPLDVYPGDTVRVVFAP